MIIRLGFVVALALWLGSGAAFGQAAQPVIPLVGGSAVGPSNPLPVVSGASETITPAAFSGLYAITLGGTAQQLAAASEIANGCAIQNPATATLQGIGAAESLFVNVVTTATLLSGGTTIEIPAGTALNCPPGKSTLAISVNAPTSGHKFGGVRW